MLGSGDRQALAKGCRLWYLDEESESRSELPHCRRREPNSCFAPGEGLRVRLGGSVCAAGLDRPPRPYRTQRSDYNVQDKRDDDKLKGEETACLLELSLLTL